MKESKVLEGIILIGGAFLGAKFGFWCIVLAFPAALIAVIIAASIGAI